VIGKVINLEGGQGLGVRVLGATEWPAASAGRGLGSAAGGGVVDMKAYEAVVDATHRFKEMFYEDVGGGGGGGGGSGGMNVDMMAGY
jgi:hypothetical protein